MTQRLPVVRQTYWVALIPQAIIIIVISFGINYVLVGFGWVNSILCAYISYILFCFIMQRIFCRYHIAGMKAYHAGRFEESITYHRASFEFFSRHRWIDQIRYALLGTSSPNPFRTIALCNMAYSETQLGHGERAIQLYEEALELTPGCMLAKTSLKMLQSMKKTPDTVKTA